MFQSERQNWHLVLHINYISIKCHSDKPRLLINLIMYRYTYVDQIKSQGLVEKNTNVDSVNLSKISQDENGKLFHYLST